MVKLGVLGVVGFAVAMLTLDATAGRGGAVRGGMRGAVVGDFVGGESGAKAGAVIGATRGAINKETTTRNAYQATPEYQTSTRSNFNEAPPPVFGATTTGSAKKPAGEAVIRKDGKPLVGVTFPEDWNQTLADGTISAVSKDGQAYSMFVSLEKAADEQDGVKLVRKGLEHFLKDVKYDEPTKTKGGAVLVTGTGKGKEAGVDIVFAAGIFDAGKGQLVGAAFVVDARIEDHYKETIRGICQTIRRAKDFDK